MASEPDTSLAHEDAYALLSRPTLDLTNAEVARVVEELRKKREAYVKSGHIDKAAKPKPPPGPKADKEEKRRNTEALLAQMVLPGGLDKLVLPK